MSDVQPSAQELSDISRLLLPGSYYCTICGDLTQDLAAFRAHIEGEAERLSHGFEDCAPCKLKGVVRTFYTGDSGRAHGEGEELFAGGSEGDRIFLLDTLEQHLEKYHSVEKPAKFGCQVCKARFSQLHRLLAHEKEKHKILRIHPCKVCQDQGVPATFETFRKMKMHLKEIHGFVYEHLKLEEDEMYGCPVCEYRGHRVAWEHQHHMVSHLKLEHGIVVPSELEIAGMVAGVKGQKTAK